LEETVGVGVGLVEVGPRFEVGDGLDVEWLVGGTFGLKEETAVGPLLAERAGRVFSYPWRFYLAIPQ